MTKKQGKLRKNRIKAVQSGIGLSEYDKATGAESGESFLKSRFARVLLAGAGFLADAYDLFVINLVLRLLRDEYPEFNATGQLHVLEGTVASAALMGSIIGQITAGSLADVFGRKKLFVLTAALITIGSFGSSMCFNADWLNIYYQICCWRFFLGLGVGGEYPLAATVTSESSSAGNRGSLMSAVFAMQGVGALMSGVIVFLCLLMGCSTNFTWRFALAFGAIPAIIAFPYRLRMHETESFERLKEDRHKQGKKLEYLENIHNQKNSPPPAVANHSSHPPLPPSHGTNPHSPPPKVMTPPPLHPHKSNPINYTSGATAGETQGLLTSTTIQSPSGFYDSIDSYDQNPHLHQIHSRPHHHFSDGTTPIKDAEEIIHNLPNINTTNSNIPPNIPTNIKPFSDLDHGLQLNTNIPASPLFGNSPSNAASPATQANTLANSTSGISFPPGGPSTFFNNNNEVNSVDSDDYGHHYYISSRNNSNNYANLLPGNNNSNGISNNSSKYNSGPHVSYYQTMGGGFTSPTRGYDENSCCIWWRNYFAQYYHYFQINPHFAEILKALRYYKWHIFGTAMSWFLLDIVFYANGLFNHEVTSMIVSSTASSTGDALQDKLKTTALQDSINSIIISSFSIPGYILSVLFIERVGRKNIQMMGFLMMAFLFLLCHYGYDYLLGSEATTNSKYIFLLIYSLTFLFSNFGPNTTTFVIPGEIYPPEVRGTCHGLSAASGKLGAAFGAYCFPLILGPGESSSPTRDGMRMAMFACASVAIVGALVTYWFIPKYHGGMLQEEGSYILLEHPCLYPPAEDLLLLNIAYDPLERRSGQGNYEMLQVIQSSHEYALDGEDEEYDEELQDSEEDGDDELTEDELQVHLPPPPAKIQDLSPHIGGHLPTHHPNQPHDGSIPLHKMESFEVEANTSGGKK